MIMKKAMPAIKDKWSAKAMHIQIQQDNTRPRFDRNFPGQGKRMQYLLAVRTSKQSWFQCHRFGIFQGNPYLAASRGAKNFQPIHAVQRAYEDMPSFQDHNVFISLQKAMESTKKSG